MRRRDFLYLTSLAAVQAASPAHVAAQAQSGGGSDEGRLDAIDRLITAKMAEHRVPGVAYGVLKDGQISTRVFGVTNLGNPQPITEDTIFPMASISKTIAATAIMRLVDEGRVSLTAPVHEYLPDFRVRDDAAGRELRVWHLLTHTAGFEGQLPTEERGTETLAHFTEGLRDLPQLSAPGEVWSYNNAGFGVAGRILEVVSGKSIHGALADLVFDPLGLSLAFSLSGTAMTYRFAVGHRQQSSGQTEVIHAFSLPANVTAGGTAMSLSNLLSYARFHLGDGTGARGQRVLSQVSLDQMKTSRLRKNATSDEMGLGWHLRQLNGVWTAAHGGTLEGHCLHVQLVPERRLAFAILTNHAQGWRLVQDVERATLKAWEGLSLASNQPIGGQRGVNESMVGHATPLAIQPPLDSYVGGYGRPPLGTIEVGEESGSLVITGAGTGPVKTSVVFYGPDLAYATSGSYTGMPFEFIRRPNGTVGWMRINGRIAKKEA